MAWLYALAFGPVLVAVGIAVGFWLVRSRRADAPGGTVRTLTAIASGFALVVVFAYFQFNFWPSWASGISGATRMTVTELRFVLPLVLGILTLVLLAIPMRGNGVHGSAELSRRTPLSFARPWWFRVFGVVLLVAVGLALAAGIASTPDEDDRYTMYWVQLGTGAAGTTIYGWFYSVPCFILLAVMVALMVADLVVISRPALALDRDKDIAVRRLRTLNVVRAGAGAVLLHLSEVLHSLASTSSMNAQVTTGIAGQISVGTSFAALTTTLQVTSLLAMVLGLALWFATFLSVIPAPIRARRRASVT